LVNLHGEVCTRHVAFQSPLDRGVDSRRFF
jgi:hypothetical protein